LLTEDNIKIVDTEAIVRKQHGRELWYNLTKTKLKTTNVVFFDFDKPIRFYLA
jgi:hypothetical protein